ncbi:MAG: hypothetical protein V3T72_10890, partial [Thermoanaerobaculia bacterium]
YRAALAIYEDLAARDPTRTGWQVRLAICHQSLGKIHWQQAKTPAALESYLQERALRKRLAESDTTNLAAQNQLSWNHLVVGRLFAQRGESENARREWLRALEIIEPISARSDAAVFLDTHAQALLELGRTSEAAPLVEELVTRGWADPEFLRLARRVDLL